MNGTIEENATLQVLKGRVVVIPKIDPTLTKSGLSADAKITGDELKKLTKRIDNFKNPFADHPVEIGTDETFTYSKWESGKVELCGYKNCDITFDQAMYGGTHWKGENIRLAFPKDSNGNNLFTSYEYVDIKPMYYHSGDIKTSQVLGVSVSEQYIDFFIEHKASAAETSSMNVTVYFHIIGTWK